MGNEKKNYVSTFSLTGVLCLYVRIWCNKLVSPPFSNLVVLLLFWYQDKGAVFPAHESPPRAKLFHFISMHFYNTKFLQKLQFAFNWIYTYEQLRKSAAITSRSQDSVMFCPQSSIFKTPKMRVTVCKTDLEMKSER